MRRLWHSEDGQALPLVILFLMVLLGILALVLDGGFAYAHKRRMQNAADAAALSGALVVIKGEWRDSMVRQTVNQYAQANGATTVDMRYVDANGNLLPNPTNGVVPTNAVLIRVTAQISFQTFFARLVGVQAMTASAQATARAVEGAMPTGMAGLAPLSVPDNFYEVCANPAARCDIWDSQYAKKWGLKASEYKSLIDLSNGAAGGSMPQNVSNWTRYGYPGEVESGVWLPTISGDYGNNVAGALRQRILEHPGGVDPDGVVWGTIDMVIWDNIRGKNPLEVHVAAFGRFKIRYTEVFGSHAYGHFIDYVVPGHDRGSDDGLAGPAIIILDR